MEAFETALFLKKCLPIPIAMGQTTRPLNFALAVGCTRTKISSLDKTKVLSETAIFLKILASSSVFLPLCVLVTLFFVVAFLSLHA